MSKQATITLIPFSGNKYVGLLTTKDGRKLYTEKETKANVLMEIALMGAYKKHPVKIKLQ